MPNIILPDGNKLSFQNKVTGFEIVEKISKSLSKKALVMSVDGELKDLSHIIKKDCCLLYTSPSPRDRQKSRMPSSA